MSFGKPMAKLTSEVPGRSGMESPGPLHIRLSLFAYAVWESIGCAYFATLFLTFFSSAETHE